MTEEESLSMVPSLTHLLCSSVCKKLIQLITFFLPSDGLGETRPCQDL